MAGPVLLPTPLPADSFALGQLLLDPLNPSTTTFSSLAPALKDPYIQKHYEDVVTHDDHGRFVSSNSGHSLSSRDNLLLVQADQSEYSSVAHPNSAFDLLRESTAARTYLRNMALQHQPLYYVSGLQKLRNPTFRRAVVKEGSITEAKLVPRGQMPMHVRRDSAMDVAENSTDVVSGIEILKVRCLVGPADEPHSIEDIGYSWSYHKLDADDLQLAIGLGKEVSAAELRALAGVFSEEDSLDESHDSDYSDDEGIAGF